MLVVLMKADGLAGKPVVPGGMSHEAIKDSAPYLGNGSCLLCDGSTHTWKSCSRYVHASADVQVRRTPVYGALHGSAWLMRLAFRRHRYAKPCHLLSAGAVLQGKPPAEPCTGWRT